MLRIARFVAFAFASVLCTFTLSTPASAAASAEGASLWQDPTWPGSDGGGLNGISKPVGTWLVGNDATTVVSRAVSNADGKAPVFVVYGIPQRDCGGASAGGTTADSYSAWIGQISKAIGSARSIVIVEPDALSLLDCLDEASQAKRYELISGAVSAFANNNENASVYIDAGHANWHEPSVMAQRLQKAGVANSNGFSVNVAAFETTAASTEYANSIQSAGVEKGFVIDTSRNGNGSNTEWCNPSGRSLGESPTTETGGSADAFLWIKRPGESDGSCNGGPGAGQFWESYAQSLINN